MRGSRPRSEDPRGAAASDDFKESDHTDGSVATYEEVWSLSVRRGFLWPSADLYGGVAGLYDYGHNGARMRRNWEDLWSEHFLGLNDSYVLVDTTTILPEAALKASGHVDHFTDILVECGKCHETYRGDHLIESATHEEHEGLSAEETLAKIRELRIRCPKCGGEIASARPFMMMFPLAIGPFGKDRAYLRPETAQGAYLNFKREFEALRRKLPMGLAIIGRAYRNEISPRQGTYRMREFLQAELQIFFDPASFDVSDHETKPRNVRAGGTDQRRHRQLRVALADEKSSPTAKDCDPEDLLDRGLPPWYVDHMGHIQSFYLDRLGVPRERFRFAELGEQERAFYNRIHFDIQIDQESIGGFREVGGLHYRGDHDLGGHGTGSRTPQEVTVDGKKVLPHVLELSFGVDRNVWALLDIGYAKNERTVLRLPARIAPVAVGVLPLLNKDGLPEKAHLVYGLLRGRFPAFYDDAGSVGRRYARLDEIGTPFCVTVDHVTFKDETVTVRERDTAKQVRVTITKLPSTLDQLLRGDVSFAALA